MKRIILFGAALALTLTGFSQESIKVSESNENVNGANNNCLVVTVYASKDEVEKGWKDEMKSWKGGSFSTKKGEMIMDDTQIKDMGDNTFDAYARVEEDGEDQCRLIVGIDLGGAYLSSKEHSDQFKVMEGIVYDFAVDATKDAIGAVLAAEEKILEDLEKDMKDLEKENEDLEKSIEDYKKKIEEAEARIEEIGEEKETKKEEIGAQEKVVEEIENKQKGVK